MSRNKFMSADDAVKLINDGDTVAVIDGGGGSMEARTHSGRSRGGSSAPDSRARTKVYARSRSR